MTKEEADKIKEVINKSGSAFSDRDDYPPYAITPWEDRNRYRGFFFKILDEFTEEV